MLEHMPAADQICLLPGIFFGVIVFDDSDTLSENAASPLLIEARIETDSAVPAETAYKREEVTFSTAYFQDCLAGQPVLFYQPFSQISHIFLKTRREMQRILIFIRILHEGGIKGPVEDMTAVVAEAEANLSPWSIQGIVPGATEHIAKDRDPRYFDNR
jgi:hypothetical protein